MDIRESLEELLLTVDKDLEKELADSVKEAIILHSLFIFTVRMKKEYNNL